MQFASDKVRRIDRSGGGRDVLQYQSSAFHMKPEWLSGGVFFGRVVMIRSSPLRMFDSPSRYAPPLVELLLETPGELGSNESGSASCVFPTMSRRLFAACRGSEKPRAPAAHASAERERTSNQPREGAVASVPLTVGTRCNASAALISSRLARRSFLGRSRPMPDTPERDASLAKEPMATARCPSASRKCRRERPD